MEQRSITVRRSLALLSLFMSASPSVGGEFSPGVWVAPAAVYFAPELDSFEGGAFKAKTYIESTVQGADRSDTIANDLSEFGSSVQAGLEVGVTISDRASVFVGGSRWDESSSGTVNAPFPLQDSLNQAEYSRSADLSFSDRYLGFEYQFHRRAEKYGLRARIAVHQAFGVDYVERYSWNVTDGAATGEHRTVNVEMTADNSYFPELAIGGTYFFWPWLMAGIDIGYVYDSRPTPVRPGSISDNFEAGDQVSIYLPIAPNGVDGDMQYRSGSRDNLEDLELDFSGWRIYARIAVSFDGIGL